jgi:lipopolysaccharide/colanic/teichoic acid biosynthesis glycosyltransferase
MRGCYLDELPQLWNVVRGEMSLVGPRPVIADEVRWWGPCRDELLSVKPGIFGAWQLTEHMEYPGRAYLELAYVRSASLSLDAEILGKTCLMLAFRRRYVIGTLVPPQLPSASLRTRSGVRDTAVVERAPRPSAAESHEG